METADRSRQRAGIAELEEECEEEEEEEEEDMDERRPFGSESAGNKFIEIKILILPSENDPFSKCYISHPEMLCFSTGVFSMDEDSISRDCEPFFESDGEEESTDGTTICLHGHLIV